MADILCWARLERLTETAAALPTTDETLMLLERVPITWLEDEERINGLCLELFNPATDFNLWERGRIFNSTFKLRWEQVDSSFQAVYCGREIDLPGFQLAEEIGHALPGKAWKLTYTSPVIGEVVIFNRDP